VVKERKGRLGREKGETERKKTSEYDNVPTHGQSHPTQQQFVINHNVPIDRSTGVIVGLEAQGRQYLIPRGTVDPFAHLCGKTSDCVG
jgi:hypothetical protein